VLCQGKKKTIHMKHSSMHVGDLIMVIFHHLAHNAVWVCGYLKLSCELKFHYTLLLFYITNKC